MVISKLPRGGAAAQEYTFIENWTQTIGMHYSVVGAIPEVDMRTLMTMHASADFLIANCTKDPSLFDDFVNEPYAMKWIGLRDYVCDGLMAIPEVKDKMLGSTYWEYILKDKVPTMTSNTTPSGEVFYSSVHPYSPWNVAPYKVFGKQIEMQAWLPTTNSTNNYYGYTFNNPICVSMVYVRSCEMSGYTNGTPLRAFTIQGSNDKSNWIDLCDTQTVEYGKDKFINLNNTNYYLHYRFYYPSKMLGDGDIAGLGGLQFYGRSLNVSVPTMTSNTQPSGEAFDSNLMPSYPAWKAFDGIVSTSDFWLETGTDAKAFFIGYDFTKPVCIKAIYYLGRTNQSSEYYHLPKAYKIQGFNASTNEWETVFDKTNAPVSANVISEAFLNQTRSFSKIKMQIEEVYYTASTRVGLEMLNFFGVDYSEHTERTYLYDHGLEFEEFSTSAILPSVIYDSNTHPNHPIVTKEEFNIKLITPNITTTGVGGVYHSSSNFNLSSVNRVVINIDFASQGSLNTYNSIGLDILNSLTDRYTFSAVVGIVARTIEHTKNGTVSLDVSNINNGFVAIRVYRDGSSSDSNAQPYIIYNELYLE